MDNKPPTNKKKLPTGPLHIKTPPLTSGGTDGIHNTKPESENLVKKKPESKKQDSTTPNLIAETSSANELTQQTPSPAKETSSIIKQDSQKLDLQKQDLSKLDSKKVAMRLSTEAAEKLKRLRAETKLPYEILVDVMIRNWDDLPVSTQENYLRQAQDVRARRLIAGQLKTVASLQQKYEKH